MMKPSLQLRIGQQLTMTPQLQQAIKLLLLPSMELQAHVRETLETNVMLEAVDETEVLEIPVQLTPAAHDAENFKEYAPLDGHSASDAQETPEIEIADEAWGEQTTGLSTTPWSGDDPSDDFSDAHENTLQEQLQQQLQFCQLSSVDLAIAHMITDAINDDGYLNDTLENIQASLLPEIRASKADVERMLALVHTLEPAGVGARNLGECIALQLQGNVSSRNPKPSAAIRELAIRIALNHLRWVAEDQQLLLRRELRCNERDLCAALSLLRACHPRPGAAQGSVQAAYIVPDVFVRRTERGWVVEVNQSTVPRVRVNEGYGELISRSPGHAMLRTQLQEARWLMRSLEIRNETLIKVARCIVERQSRFFERGEEAMLPLILKDVAEVVEMHESTISRVTTAKYMHTPRGVFEFRYFFSSHVGATDGTDMSSIAIRARLKKLIALENPENPCSDAKLAQILSQDGIPVARRTIAKYREGMQIAPSNERKRAAARVEQKISAYR